MASFTHNEEGLCSEVVSYVTEKEPFKLFIGNTESYLNQFLCIMLLKCLMEET